MGWATMAGPQLFAIGSDMFKFVVFQNPAWDYKTFNFDSDAARTATVSDKILNAMDPNLKPFTSHGKLIQYHGWADPQIAPGNSLAYYKTVVDAMGGAAKINDSYRLFMVPGMAHCGGGDGTASFDMLTALEQWVEAGKAPAKQITVMAGERGLPMCSYPAYPKYTTGAADAAASYTCAQP